MAWIYHTIYSVHCGKFGGLLVCSTISKTHMITQIIEYKPGHVFKFEYFSGIKAHLVQLYYSQLM